MHTLLIAQESIERDGDIVTKVLPFLNGKSATEIASFMDVVWYLFVDKAGERKIITSTDARFITKDRSNKIWNDTDVDFGVWVEKVKAIKLGEQKVIHDGDIAEDPVDETPATDAPVDKEPQAPVETPTEHQTQPQQAKLPANKVKQVQIKWRDYADKMGWNTADSDIKRKATMHKYYWVDSANDLTVEQADDFVSRIQVAIDKVVAQ